MADLSLSDARAIAYGGKPSVSALIRSARAIRKYGAGRDDLAYAKLAEARAALNKAAPWLGRLIADGGHRNCVSPNDAERTLEMVEAVLNGLEI